MTDIYQESDALVGDLTPEQDVLFKARVRVSPVDYTLSGAWYRAVKVVDLAQLNISSLITLDFYYTDGTLYKGPVVVTSNAGAIVTNVSAEIAAGIKSGSQSTKITFRVGNNHGGQADIYFKVIKHRSADGSFPLVT